MKFKIYFDVWPWSKPKDLFFSAAPAHSKPDGATRYAVEVEIPDQAKPDVVIQGSAVEEK